MDPASPSLTLDQALQLAIQNHSSGRLGEAEHLYRQILAAAPNHPDATHLLGVIAHQVGQNDVALQMIDRAIALRPGVGAYHNNRGQVFRALGRSAEAIEAYQRAASGDPADPDCRANLAIALRETGQFAAATAAARAALEKNPRHPAALAQLAASLLSDKKHDEARTVFEQAQASGISSPDLWEVAGSVELAAGNMEQAEAWFRRVLDTAPANSSALNQLGLIHARRGNLAAAETTWRKLLDHHPAHREGWLNLAIACFEQGRHSESAAAYRKLIDLKGNLAEAYGGLSRIHTLAHDHAQSISLAKEGLRHAPGSARALNLLGVALYSGGQADEARVQWLKALEIDPSFVLARNNLAACLSALGAPDEGIPHYRRMLELDPTLSYAHSNLLLDLHYLDDPSPIDLRQEHLAWARQHAADLKQVYRFDDRSRDPHRPLKVGYVSPDFRAHSVADFMEPILSHHRPEQVDVFCYARVARPDSYTERLRAKVPHWRDVATWSDQAVADQVVADQVDLLIDLAGHTAHGRPLIFAAKPAPILLSYLGYPDTTGLSAVDYRLTDGYADPPGLTEAHFTETLLRLPRTAWCYHPSPQSPPVSLLPADAAGRVTFGSFNNLAKVTPRTIQLWARVLQAVPGSVLLLKAGGLNSEWARLRLLRSFEQHGISPSRLILHGRTEDFVAHLAIYSQMDIALDPFPYHGTTTTCEALWMGVPVVTLAGRTHVSRVGVSLLTNLGRPQWIAADREQYVQLCADLAADLPRLRTVRAHLRDEMTCSPLLDAPGFVRELEAAYRHAWITYLGRLPA